MQIILSQQVDIESIGEPTDNGKSVSEIIGKIECDLLMKKLTRKQKKIIKLRIKGYKYKEIGEKLNMDWTLVAKSIGRVKKKFRAMGY